MRRAIARRRLAPFSGSLLLAVLAFSGGLVGQPIRDAAAGGPSNLAVWRSGGWRAFWRSDRARAHWAGPDSTLAGAVDWKRAADGVEWGTVRLACAAPAWRAKLIVARLDPARLDLSLQLDMTRDQRPAWTIDRAPGDAVLAVNTGQFVGGMPWGWVVRDGAQLLMPGRGPLASAVCIDRTGRVRWTHGDVPRSAENAEFAFQSYPTLLAGGEVPLPLQRPGLGVHYTHRDARLAIGETADHHLLIVLTRFDAMGEITGALPLGPTTPEMAAIIGALGARDAVMLDGGISAQLLLRDSGSSTAHRWPGMRKVPLALIARERVVTARRN